MIIKKNKTLGIIIVLFIIITLKVRVLLSHNMPQSLGNKF